MKKTILPFLFLFSSVILSAQEIQPDEIVSMDSVFTDSGTIYTTKERFGSTVYTFVEKIPEFPGGIDALMNYLSKNIKYPKVARKNNIQGKVYIKFIVSADGSINDVTIIRGIGGGCEEEAVRVVENMPRWSPGYANGEAVDVYYSLPIIFTLGK
jgi:TonB family protein